MAAQTPWIFANPKSRTTPFFGKALAGRTTPVFTQLPGMRTGGAVGPVAQGGGGGGGGGNPYSGILNEFLNSSKAKFAADSAADAASRDAALRRMIISYGQVPDFDKLGISDSARGFLQGALNDKTRQLAEANTKEGTSVYARQAHANEVANRRIPASLAARGMLRSGQTGSDLGEQAQNYKIQSFDTLNELLGSAEGTVSNFLQAERARQEALAQAELQAQMAAAGEYGGDMYGEGGGGSFMDTINTLRGGPRTGPYQITKGRSSGGGGGRGMSGPAAARAATKYGWGGMPGRRRRY